MHSKTPEAFNDSSMILNLQKRIYTTLTRQEILLRHRLERTGNFTNVVMDRPTNV